MIIDRSVVPSARVEPGMAARKRHRPRAVPSSSDSVDGAKPRLTSSLRSLCPTAQAGLALTTNPVVSASDDDSRLPLQAAAAPRSRESFQVAPNRRTSPGRRPAAAPRTLTPRRSSPRLAAPYLETLYRDEADALRLFGSGGCRIRGRRQFCTLDADFAQFEPPKGLAGGASENRRPHEPEPCPGYT